MTWGPIGARFDDLIHFPTRLRIAAALATATDVEFSLLEDALGISTSLLSKQLIVLADAGYIALEKRPQPFGRPRTWIRSPPPDAPPTSVTSKHSDSSPTPKPNWPPSPLCHTRTPARES